MKEMTVYALLGAILAHLLGFILAMNRRARPDDCLALWPIAWSYLAVLLTATALGSLITSGVVSKAFFLVPMPGHGSLTLGAFANGLSAGFALAISVLALLVFKFSQRYLRADSSEKSFYAWGHLTVASVLTMTIADNLAFFGLCWLATSFALHKLLTLYAERPAAQFAAKKKFIISRVGDLCLIAAGFLIYGMFGTLNFAELAALAAALPGAASTRLNLIGALLVVGAMTKSAQVPFQSWLPETLEAPTPVSALMHAGVINSGGYLILRTYDLVHSATWAVEFMCTVGILSAVVCGLSKLTAPDIKKRLAHSTSAQMGFMFLQLGLGVPGAAFLHMLGHAFFKAHAFLTSGTLPVRRSVFQQSLTKTLLSIGAISALGLAPVFLQVTGIMSGLTFSAAVATSFLCIAGFEGIRLAFMQAPSSASTIGAIAFAIAWGAAVATIGGHFFAGFLGLATPVQGTASASVTASLLALSGFFALFWLQALLPHLHATPRLRSLYVLARNGFYFEALTRRALRH